MAVVLVAHQVIQVVPTLAKVTTVALALLVITQAAVVAQEEMALTVLQL